MKLSNEVDLKMEDVLCTCEDWVSRGRLEDTMRDDCDSEGRLLYITMEGVAYRDPETAANQLLHHLKKFPVYLLGPANDMIGTIIMNANNHERLRDSCSSKLCTFELDT